MINVRDVTRRFGRARAVDGVTLDVPEGDSVALWGANGAGKTTLVRCALGLLRFGGEIRVGGRDVRRDGKRARLLVGYVPQELGFYDELRVGEAVTYFARLRGLALRSPAGELERVGLGGHGGKRVRELSGGMKQRLALAIALLGDPPVLVLDEVTASLDAVGRGEFVALLSGLSGAGRTMLFASHRVDEVATLARRVAVMERGRLREVVPAHDFARALISASGSGGGAPGGAVGTSTRGAVLHLTLAAAARPRAMEALRAGGFSPSLNGVGVLVPVPADQKAAPIRLLSEARISVDDFELLSAERAGATTHGEAQP